MMIIKFANYLTITQKRYTKHDLHIGFKVRRKPMIIIDPGHGGRDLGTQSISGSYEKNITLVMAIELMQNLLDSGRYNVFLTRDGDFNVSMDKRRKIFCKKHGDLLISLHTNGGSTARMRGISVYTLPTLGFSQKLCDTSNIDGTKCHKNLHMSHRFAEALTDYIPNVCKLHRHTHGNNNLKILEIDKPAVLISCGNLSDRRDNNLLHSKKFRDRTNKAILYALDKFFGRENK
jgi:N-acetylmuramoyl-L-alanine amidase